MTRIFLILSLLLIWSIPAKYASAANERGISVEAPRSGVAGAKIPIKANTATPLPASSFYRIAVDCPDKPEGALVSGEMGYSVSDVIFSADGLYRCILSLGILTRSSCATTTYSPLEEVEFTIEITP